MNDRVPPYRGAEPFQDNSNRTEADRLAEADRATARAATRIASAYALRTLAMISQPFQGDFITAIIFRAVIVANIGHIDEDPVLGSKYASLDSVPPDDLRRPVSVLALAQSLGIPYETTRRYVKKLIDAGALKSVRGGVIAPGREMKSEAGDQASLTNLHNLRRLFRALKRAGVRLE